MTRNNNRIDHARALIGVAYFAEHRAVRAALAALETGQAAEIPEAPAFSGRDNAAVSFALAYVSDDAEARNAAGRAEALVGQIADARKRSDFSEADRLRANLVRLREHEAESRALASARIEQAIGSAEEFFEFSNRVDEGKKWNTRARACLTEAGYAPPRRAAGLFDYDASPAIARDDERIAALVHGGARD